MANSYLTHSGSTPTLNTKCTLSVWIKRSVLDTDQTFCSIDTDGNNEIYYRFRSDNQLQVYSQITGGQVFNYRTNRLFRDTSAWYHIVTAIDTTQAGGNRMKIYVNGTQETSFQSSTEMNQNSALGFLSGTYAIGRKNNVTSNYFNGYLSHVAFVDGQQLAPTVFGQTDSTSGIWKFKPPSGVTWGTNGFHLKFENSGALGTDSSGNTNTFTVNGNLKQSLSTPSNNYNTWNFNNKYNNMTISNAGTAIAWQQTSSDAWCVSNLAVDSGKWYWEWKASSEHPEANSWGVKDVDTNLTTNPGANSGIWMQNQGNKYNGSNGGSYGTQIDIGNIGMVALDMDNGKIWLGENGTWFASGDPAAGSNAMYTNLSGKTVSPFHADTYSTYTPSSHYNFGEGRFATTDISSAGSNGNGSLFEYDVPSGFYALNTKNINTYG
jgi:hypothetical protein